MTDSCSSVRRDLTRTAFRTLNSVVEPVARLGIGNPLPVGLGVAVVETTGRVSGATRSVPLVTARVGRRVFASTVRPGSQWAKNADADDRVAVWLQGRRRTGRAEVEHGPLTTATITLD